MLVVTCETARSHVYCGPGWWHVRDRWSAVSVVCYALFNYLFRPLFNFVQALVQFCSITIVGQDGEFVQFVQSACSMFKMSGLYGLWGSHLFVTPRQALTSVQVAPLGGAVKAVHTEHAA